MPSDLQVSMSDVRNLPLNIVQTFSDDVVVVVVVVLVLPPWGTFPHT